MATIFDASVLAVFVPVFVFLFIFVVLFAILEKTKLFGDNTKALNVMAAFSVAVIATFTGKLVNLVTIITPWIAFMFIVMLFIVTMFMFFGVETQKGLSRGVGKQSFWMIMGETPVFVMVLIIVFIALTQVFETQLSPYQTVDGVVVDQDGQVVAAEDVNPRSEALRTLTHPRILSALFILIVSALAVRYIVDKYEP